MQGHAALQLAAANDGHAILVASIEDEKSKRNREEESTLEQAKVQFEDHNTPHKTTIESD